MKKFLVAGIAAAALCGAPAFAADIPTKAPVYKAAAAPFSWTGPYWGLNAGYGWNDPTVNFSTNDPLLIAAGPPIGGASLRLPRHSIGTALWAAYKPDIIGKFVRTGSRV